MSELLDVTGIQAPALVVQRKKGGFYPGVALPSGEGKVDIYLSPYPTDSTTRRELLPTAELFASAVLGALDAWNYDCTPHSEESLLRLDHAGVVQAAIVAVADQMLERKGRKRQAVTVPFATLSLAKDTMAGALCTPHSTDPLKWRRSTLKALQGAGGIGEFTIHEGVTAERAQQLQVIRLPQHNAVVADKQPGNLVYAQAWQQQIAPRIEATNLRPDQVAEILIQGSIGGESTTETINRASRS